MRLRTARALVIGVLGITLVLIGVPLWISPVPGGALVVPFGLALLASEFVWAQRLLKRVKAHTEYAMGYATNKKPARQEDGAPAPDYAPRVSPGKQPLPESEG